MTDKQEIVYQPTRHSQHTRKLRCTKRRLITSIIVEGIIVLSVNLAIATLFLSCLSGITAIGCWGLEIAHTNINTNIIISVWHYQKMMFLGWMLVYFSIFLGASLVGAYFALNRDKF